MSNSKTRKKGEMAIYYAIFMLVLCFLMFPLFQFLSLYEEGISLRNKIQTDLNSFGVTIDINARDNIKRGNLKADEVHTNRYETEIFSGLGLSKNGNEWSDSKKNYSISDVTFQSKLQGEAIITFCQYQLKLPVKLVGMTIITPVIPQTAETYLAKKYFPADEYKDKCLSDAYVGGKPANNASVHSINVTACGGGTASVDNPECTSAEVCTVTATPNIGKTFIGWESEVGTIISTNKVYSFKPTENTALVAVFE